MIAAYDLRETPLCADVCIVRVRVGQSMHHDLRYYVLTNEYCQGPTRLFPTPYTYTGRPGASGRANSLQPCGVGTAPEVGGATGKNGHVRTTESLKSQTVPPVVPLNTSSTSLQRHHGYKHVTVDKQLLEAIFS